MVQEKKRYWLAGNRAPEQDIFFVEALDPAIWRQGDAENWDSCWHTGMPGPDVFEQLDETKTINHIPGNNGLTIKNYLFETLSAAASRVAGQAQSERMAFFPRVYAMPEDYIDLQQTAARQPEKRWIRKPKNSSRGRGIQVIRDIAAAPLDKRWLVQEYVDNPHLMKERKYVLRLYLLITSIAPLLVYFYEEGFAKLASDPYDENDPDNPFSNLTNPDINVANREADTPVEFVGLGEYRKWLREGGHDDRALFAKIRDLLALTAISVRDRMRARTRAVDADMSGCYELLGVDCLVDADLKPWILECNLSPSLEVCASPDHGGEMEARIKRSMVADMVSLVGLNEPIREPINLSTEEGVHQRAERELARAGGFQRIFPAEDVEDYLPYFPVPRYADMVLAKQITGRPTEPLKLVPRQTSEIVCGDELALYSEKTGTLYAPNPSASWIWLKALDGADPEEIANELVAAHIAAHGAISSDEDWRIRENVWDVLAEWAGMGLVQRGGEAAAGVTAATGPVVAAPDVAPDWAGADQISIGGAVLELRYGCPAAARRLRQTLKPLLGAAGAERAIAIQRSPRGYAVAAGSKLIATDLGLAHVAPVICRVLFEHAPTTPASIAMAGALVPLRDGDAALIIGDRRGGWDGLALALAQMLGAAASGAVRLDLGPEGEGAVAPLGLPLRINEDDVGDMETMLGHRLAPHIHQWPSGEEGRMLMIGETPNDAKPAIRAIILPERRSCEAHKEAEAAIRPLSARDALNAVLPSCAGPRLRLGGAAASALADWLAGREVWTLAFSDFADAAALLANRLDAR